MPAVNSRRENPRQRKSENVDGNNRLGYSRVALGARVWLRQLSLFNRLCSRRVVMCLVVVHVRSFVPSYPHRITSI